MTTLSISQHEQEHGPGVDEAPMNDLDDGESSLDPEFFDDPEECDDASMDLG